MALTKVTGGLLGNLPTGTGNVAVGDTALDSIESGAQYNVAIGSAAGTAITTGTNNTLIGGLAGDALTSAVRNVAVGKGALSSDTLGNASVAIGEEALSTQNFTTATNVYNVAVGHNAGSAVTTGVQNTLIGGLAGDAITTANENTAVGYAALTSSTTASGNTAMGWGSMINNTTGYASVAMGLSSLASQTTAGYSTAVGYLALAANTTASFNTAVGGLALTANTTGAENVAVGVNTLDSNTTGSNNTGLGTSALATNTTASNNTGVGHLALSVNTTGYDNTATGVSALAAVTTGYSNTAFGKTAGSLITTGASNTILGRYDGNQGGVDIRTSNNNIVLSDGAGNVRFRANSSGQVVVGDSVSSFGGGGYGNTGFTVNQDSSDYNAAFRTNTSTAAQAYGIFIHYPLVTPNNGQNNFITCNDSSANRFLVKSNGGINNYQANDANLSDERVKKDISLLGSMWDKFKAIEIVNFKYKDQTNDDFNIGVIAQQLESVAPEFIDNSGFGETPEGEDPLKAVFTADLYHATIKALQEAMTRIETLEAEVTALKEG